jgi:hypothetical protein
MRVVIILLLFCGPALADCPPDRPHARTVVEYPSMITCTLLACMPRLVCPTDGSERCGYQTWDCNRCTPEPVDKQLCLSDEELVQAMWR